MGKSDKNLTEKTVKETRVKSVEDNGTDKKKSEQIKDSDNKRNTNTQKQTNLEKPKEIENSAKTPKTDNEKKPVQNGNSNKSSNNTSATDKQVNLEINISKDNPKNGGKEKKTDANQKGTQNKTNKKADQEAKKSKLNDQMDETFGQIKKGFEKVSEGAQNLKLPDNRLITAIGLIIIGMMFCIFRTNMLSIMLTVIGVVLIALAIYSALKRKYVMACVEGAIGIVIIACGWTVIDISLLILGIIFIGFSVMELIENAHDFKIKTGTAKVLSIIDPILLLTFGILLVVSKWVLTDAICIVVGIIAAVDGILMLVKDGVKKRG